MKVKYLGQSCVEFEFDGKKVLLDPFISDNPLAKDVKIDEIKPDYIFLTHCHGDHVADLAVIQQNSQASVYTIVESGSWVEKQGVASDKITAFNFGGKVKLPFGSAKMVYALHTNSTPNGDYAGVPVGYIFEAEGKKVYFAGDTALTMEMKLLESLHLDWAFLPLGGFYTMDVDDAIIAAEFINCTNIVGIHYDTFPPITIDKEEAMLKFERAGLNLCLPKVGETIVL